MVSQMCLELDVIPRVRLSKADWPLIKGQKNEVHILHQNFIILLIAFCLLGRATYQFQSIPVPLSLPAKSLLGQREKIIHLPIHPPTHSLTYFLPYLYLILWNAVYRCSWPVDPWVECGADNAYAMLVGSNLTRTKKNNKQL